jgi:hypothetical protein
LKVRTYLVSFLQKEILILEYSYLDSLKLACPWSLFLSRVSLVEYSPYSGFVKPLVAGAVHEQVYFGPCCMTVVVEESDDE